MVLHPSYKDKAGNWIYPNLVEEKDGQYFHAATKEPLDFCKNEKMSKSKNNIVDLNAMMLEYGVDNLRLFVLSDNPPEKDLEWSAAGIDGCKKFLTRLFDMSHKITTLTNESTENLALEKLIHKTIKHVTNDISNINLNKAVARIRELFNALNEAISDNLNKHTILFGYKVLLQLANPFIPHLTEEIWQQLAEPNLLAYQNWPQHIEELTKDDQYILAIQINGKLRTTYEFNNDASEEEIKSTILQLESLSKYLHEQEVIKIILVPKKILNIVVKSNKIDSVN
jgi:leucyl-tRNA synthetase